MLVSRDIDVFERRESNVRTYCRDIPLVFTEASGAELRSADGRTVIDLFSGAGALNYGHNEPAMKSALNAYLQTDGIVHGLDLHTVPKRDLLLALERDLLEPRGWDYKVQFPGPTGADANEAALKLARLATGRRGIVAFNGSYHGMSAGALSVSGARRLRQAAGPLLNETTFVPFESSQYGGFDSLAFLERLSADEGSGSELPAAVIVEAVQIQAGVYPASPDWLRGLRRWTADNGVVLILDEVQAGCGRTGAFFGFEHAGITPDIITTAKSIGGFGLPMALVFISPKLDVWKPGQHTGTFRGNQLAFVTATVALEFWQDPAFLDLVRANCDTVRAAGETLRTLPTVADFRCQGLIAGVDFGLGNTEQARAVQAGCLDRGVLVERCGPTSEVIKLMPPINIPTEQLEHALKSVESAIAS